MFLVFVFLFVIVFLFKNLILMWLIFLISTFIFIFYCKQELSSSGFINYFIIQEFFGFLFLIFMQSFVSFLFICLKIGISPFHFWMMNVFNNVSSWRFILILTFQKLPFIPIIVDLFNSYFLFLFLFGIYFCCMQQLIFKNNLKIVFLNSIESFNWFIFCSFFFLMSLIFNFVIYMICSFILLLNVKMESMNVLFNLDLLLFFLNMPFTISFFIKVFIMSFIFKSFFLFLFLILTFLFSSIPFFDWYLLIFMKSFNDFFLNFKYLIFLYYLFIFMFIFYFFSKYLLYCFDSTKFLKVNLLLYLVNLISNQKEMKVNI